MITGKEIAKAAMPWLGTPHVNQARVRGRGVDCGMLLIAALEDSGAIKSGSIPIAPYSNEWHLHHSEEWFLSYVKKYCEPVKREDMQEGDFLLFQYGRCISHGAIYIGNHTIIHAVVQQGVILSDLDDVMLYNSHGKSRLRAIYRFKGVQ